ncbi:MAG: hypothetical protein H8E27_04080 [Verrucomicrobia subdivision 3 bacterium]|nr:hypothetical protein [Limisphaerales bacterium]
MKPTLYFLVLGLLASACGDQPEPDINDNSSGNPATAPVDYLGAVNKGRNKAIIDAGLLQVNSALNQYQATSSQPPASLQELISEGLLAELPVVPNGMKWNYNPETGVASVVPTQ